jgi:hypothetical protein
MQSMQLTAHVENNGLLQIRLPPEFSDCEIDLFLVMQKHTEKKQPQQQWLEFINKTYGSCADDPITRPEALPLEIREELL